MNAAEYIHPSLFGKLVSSSTAVFFPTKLCGTRTRRRSNSFDRSGHGLRNLRRKLENEQWTPRPQLSIQKNVSYSASFMVEIFTHPSVTLGITLGTEQEERSRQQLEASDMKHAEKKPYVTATSFKSYGSVLSIHEIAPNILPLHILHLFLKCSIFSKSIILHFRPHLSQINQFYF